MIHPLLTPRLFFQANSQNQRSLPSRRERVPRPVRDFALRVLRQQYLRWGSSVGFISGLALVLWALLPDV